MKRSMMKASATIEKARRTHMMGPPSLMYCMKVPPISGTVLLLCRS
jgi:hypothetical protein